jgi:two-component system nitrate/nitrite response regulator NarL
MISFTAGNMKILIADNHELILESMRGMLEEHFPQARLRKASDGIAALDEARRFSPDVIISDFKMPGLNGLELISRLRQEAWKGKFVVLTMVNELMVIQALMAMKADGIISKECDKTEILKGVAAVLRGESFVCSNTKNVLNQGQQAPSKIPVLSKREQEVLRLICEEKKNKEIASILHISVYTIETHKKNLIRKLNVKSTVGLVKYAYDSGLFGGSSSDGKTEG